MRVGNSYSLQKDVVRGQHDEVRVCRRARVPADPAHLRRRQVRVAAIQVVTPETKVAVFETRLAQFKSTSYMRANRTEKVRIPVKSPIGIVIQTVLLNRF